MGMVRRVPPLLVRPTALEPRAVDGEREQSCRLSCEHEQEHCIGARQPDLEPGGELRPRRRIHLRGSQNRGWTQGAPEPAPGFGEVCVLGSPLMFGQASSLRRSRTPFTLTSKMVS